MNIRYILQKLEYTNIAILWIKIQIKEGYDYCIILSYFPSCEVSIDNYTWCNRICNEMGIYKHHATQISENNNNNCIRFLIDLSMYVYYGTLTWA